MIRLTSSPTVETHNHYVGGERDWPAGLWFGKVRGYPKGSESQLVYRTHSGFIIWLSQEKQSESPISAGGDTVDVRRVNVSGTLEYL